MKHLATLLAGLLVAAPIAAVEEHGNVLILDEEDVAACTAGGGCALMSMRGMNAYGKEAFDKGRATCGKTT